MKRSLLAALTDALVALLAIVFFCSGIVQVEAGHMGLAALAALGWTLSQIYLAATDARRRKERRWS